MSFFTEKKQYLIDKYIKENKTIVQISKELGVSYSTVQRGLEENGIDTDRSRAGKYKRTYEHIKRIKERLTGMKYKAKSEEIRKKYREGAIKRIKDNPYRYSLTKNYQSKTSLKIAMEKIYGKNECFLCGYNEHKEILHVHHKDMNHSNNTLENCIWVCPNCHSYIHYQK